MRWAAAVLALAFIIGAALIPDTQAGADSPYPAPDPIWIWSDCDLPSVTVAWFNPPAGVEPFPALFSGFLIISGNGYGDSEIMQYTGISTCPIYPGCYFHRWRKVYTPPPGRYTLSAYVVNAANQVFYVQPEIFDPGCNGQIDVQAYLPVILK